MSKHVSPLLGYNNNVRHKNRVFHIQTEDSGIKHPHIITHLFMDGGRILKSIKRSYAEHVGADKMQDLVKGMMKEQHKAMFIALRDGQFDHLLEDVPAAKGAKAAEAKAEKEKADAEKEKAEKAAAEAAPVAAPAPPAPPPPPAPAPPPVALGTTGAHGAAPKSRTDPAPPPSALRDDEDMVPMTTRTPELTLDIGVLERAAASPQGTLRQVSDLPPPPANMFREKPASGGYRAAPTGPEPTPPKRGNTQPPKKPASAPPKKGAPASEGRYQAARPAAIFGQSRPQQGSSIFGEDLISDKSLDEVILSYLAEDLEPAAEKKK